MKFDEVTADEIIGQLAAATQILEQGRAFGIRIVASSDALDALEQSSHPDKDRVIGNILCLNNPYPDSVNRNRPST